MNIKSVVKRVWHRLADDRGASGIEYAIVATLVAVVLVGFSGPIGTAVKGVFISICNAIGGTGCPTA